MPQLEQSSLQPSTDLHHRHLLQTTSYNHLLLLHLLISRKEKRNQQQASSRGLRSQKGLRPFNPLQNRLDHFNVLDDHMESKFIPLICDGRCDGHVCSQNEQIFLSLSVRIRLAVPIFSAANILRNSTVASAKLYEKITSKRTDIINPFPFSTFSTHLYTEIYKKTRFQHKFNVHAWKGCRYETSEI